MKLPDIIGLTMGQAEKILKSLGLFNYSVVVTTPPREPIESVDSSFRVVRTLINEKGSLELTVCKPL